MPRINEKHFTIFNNGGVISVTTSKDWARANGVLFFGYTFEDLDATPIVTTIKNYLINTCESNRVENDEIVIHYAFKET